MLITFHLILKAEIVEIAFKTRLFCFFNDISILFWRCIEDIFNHLNHKTMKKVVYHGISKSYSVVKTPKVNTNTVGKKLLKDNFGGAF